MRGDPRATRRQVLRLGSCGCGDEGERQEGPASHDKLLSGGAVTVLSGGGSVTSANPRYIDHAEPPSRHVARDPARVAACPPLQAHCRTLSLIHISEPTRLLSISYAVFCLK